MVYFAYGFPSSFRLESEAEVGGQDPEALGKADTPGDVSTTRLVSMGWPDKTDDDVAVLVTTRTVQVWSGGQSRVKLGESNVPLHTGDQLAKALCCGEKSRVAVVSEQGSLMVFEYRSGDVMEWSVELESPLHAYEIVLVHQELLVQTDGASEEGVVDICGDGDVFAVVFPSGDFQTYDWFGRLIHRHSPLENNSLIRYLKEFGVSAMSSIVCVDYCAARRLVAMGFDNGIVLLVHTVLDEDMMGENMGQRGLYKVVYVPKKKEDGGACILSFHPKGQYLAVGVHAADVVLVHLAHVFEMKGDNDVSGKNVDDVMHQAIAADVGLESKVLSLTGWGHRRKELGKVSSLAWSPDGKVLAVGNRIRGLTVWTTRGCKILCTIPSTYRDTALLGGMSPRLLETSFSSSPNVPTPRMESKESPAVRKKTEDTDVGAIGDDGVVYMIWSVDGGHLLVHEAGSDVFHDLTFAHCCDSHVIRTSNAPFCRSTTRLPDSGVANFFLIGSDRLLLITPSAHLSSEPGRKDGEKDVPDLVVQHVRVPQQYLDTGFSLKLASLNPSGTDIVVSGSQGACVYHVLQKKWRVFGDVTQDKAIHAWHLGWIHDDILVICATVQGARNSRLPNSKAALYYFPKHYLDASSLLGFTELDDIPILFDCSNGRLSLLFKSGKVQVMNHRVESTRDHQNNVHSLDVEVEYEFETEERLRTPLQSMTVMNKSNNHGLWCVILSESGDLWCLDLETKEYIALADNIDYFWVPHLCDEKRQDVFPRNIEIPWWTYGEGGMKLWFDTQMLDSGEHFSDGDPELGFDPEVLPIGVSLEEVSIVGLMHRVHRKYTYFSGGVSTEFTPLPESQPVLACMLRRLLRKDRFKDALALADMYSHRPHFSRSLEWLLFTALDANENQQIKNGLDKNDAGSDLLKSAELLSHFPQSAELVVSVARKTEAELWPPLFQASGSPITLSENLLRDGALENAACCLLIINEVFGQSEASSMALKILKSALSVSQYTLSADLLRFLAPDQDIEAHQETTRKSNVQANSDKGPGYLGWLWQLVAPTEAPTGNKMPIENSTGIDDTTEDIGMERTLHESWKISTDDPKYLDPPIDAWRTLARQAWRLLDSGNIKELAVFDKAMKGLFGGLSALFKTTKSLHPTSLGHTTPSSSMIASALFVVSNELASAQNELELIPDLLQSLLDSGNINYAIALAIVANEHAVTTKFCAENKKVWESLATLIANDVHLCAFTSVLQSAALPHSLARTFTI
ncbi:RAB6A-GEF complex partner protein 1 [Picochlorum sp. SENEW3]|nr:RAB6A-GEF complex partner protein 1 [Picochlorum sp. SENEW3]